ncbi:hypothetical protein RO3G_11412 [Rhizopus delemar RA 99-880]|uniref:Uncharacterized protein n=1 Tax=Rhizopus delemar (strain RA 99-880 / ATCC MYA-4621 / FGSC 9543 / NRRL 43880) TaxID=246409 RepID=I1CE21_RHIO9|nr:hypothetical protein RO3G_11412 [Rhizopus delemar RA 99-880]|eukprot:EIE86701.1 hypothetical protein RO3G_11412 [Rhizopus delemar RA 99-880]
MASFFLSENGTPLISPNPTSSRYISLEAFRTHSMTFLLINRFVTLETTPFRHAIDDRHHSNHVKNVKNYDSNRLGRIKIRHLKHM